ncbi:MAG TPA: HAD family hydrolase [Syntrophales bacterium]|nr:HAD family hydrolase [Syntrophales bacterium]
MNDIEVDTVLFDFGGVIAEEGFKDGLAAIAKANGFDENTFAKVAHEAIYSTGYIVGRVPESIYCGALREKTGIKGNDASIRNEIFSRFTVRDWMIDLVKTLKAQGITVGILSDQTDMLDMLDKKYDFFKWFDYIFNSYHMGKGKRDHSLFDDVVYRLKTEPDRILFIDNNPRYVDRAREKGWKGIHYVDRDRFEKDIEEIFELK